MKPSRIWITAAVLIAFIWGAVAVVMRETDPLVSWPEKVTTLAEETPWLHGQESTHEARQQHLDRLITSLNRLDPKQRQSLREDGQPILEKFFDSLTDEEQKEYVDRTVNPYFEGIDRAFKNMPEEDRKRFLTRMKSDLKNLRPNPAGQNDSLSNRDREFMETMIADDPISFLREAPPKMKLAPMLEEMQSRLQSMRR